MRLPINMLLDTSGGHKSLIYKTFRVGYCFIAVKGENYQMYETCAFKNDYHSIFVHF